MDYPATINQQNTYDPRWFIWTIVFLVVSGISLVSYIVMSETPGAEAADVTTHRAAKPLPSATSSPAVDTTKQ